MFGRAFAKIAMSANPRSIGALSIALLMLSILGTSLSVPGHSDAAPTYTPHDFIRINSGDDLVVGENGIVTGTGSSSNPYVITGWRIGAFNGSSGIEIWNTKAHISLLDLNVSYCNIGILLYNVSHVSVRNSVFFSNILGVSIQYSDDVKVSGCTFRNNTFAMTIAYSGVSKSGNTYINNGQNVIEKSHPWEQGPLGTLVCLVILVPLAIVVSFGIYFRIKHRPKPPPIIPG